MPVADKTISIAWCFLVPSLSQLARQKTKVYGFKEERSCVHRRNGRCRSHTVVALSPRTNNWPARPWSSSQLLYSLATAQRGGMQCPIHNHSKYPAMFLEACRYFRKLERAGLTDSACYVPVQKDQKESKCSQFNKYHQHLHNACHWALAVALDALISPRHRSLQKKSQFLSEGRAI